MKSNQRLRRERELRGWSQARVATEVGTDPATVSRWERGLSFPYPYFREKLCVLFGKNAEELGLVHENHEEPAESAPPPPSITQEAAADTPATLYDVATPLPSTTSSELIGRDTLLQQLKGLLCSGESALQIALNGLPGAGKTSLAVHLAHDKRILEYFQHGILWAGLGPTPNVLGHLSRWGTLLGVASDEPKNKNCTIAWAEGLRARIGTRQVLLIIDDAWTLEDALALKVGGPNCAMLITTRFPHIALNFAGDQAFTVSELNQEDGVALLMRLVPGLETLDLAIIQKLAQLGGGLPLALTLMGKYLRVQAHSRQPRRIHAAVTRLFDAQERLLLSEPYALVERHTSLEQGTSLSLQSVIAVSDQMLDEQVGRALRALSIFPSKPHSFSEEAAVAITNLPIEVLDALSDAGLLESSSPNRYTLHQTIADYARLSLSDPGPSERMVQYFVQYVQRHAKDYNTLEKERVHIFAALDIAHQKGMKEELICGAIAFASFLQARSLYSFAEVYLQRAYEAAQELQQTRDITQILLHLGRVVRWLGDIERGERYLREGLILARNIDSRECICGLLNALGEILRLEGHLLQSEECHQEALNLAREIGHNEHMGMALASLGRLARNRADYAQAEPYLREALDIARRLQNQELIIFILWTLSVVFFEQGLFANGEVYLLEALKLARQIGHYARISTLLINLGTTYGEQKNYTSAYKYLLEGMTIARQYGLPDSICLALINLASLGGEQGRYEQAIDHLQESHALARHHNYPWHISVTLTEWGEIYLKQQRLAEAIQKFEEAFTVAPEGSRELQMTNRFGIARVAALQGDIVRARELGEICVNFFESKGHRQAKTARQWYNALPAAQ